MIDITKILRGIKILELEPENIVEIYNDEKLTEYKVEHLTDLITYSKEKNKIIYPDQELDKYVNIEDKIIINVYEVLNSKGINKIYQEKNDKNKNMILISLLPLKGKPKSFDDIKNKLIINKDNDNIKTPLGHASENKEEIKIASLEVKMTYLQEQEIDSSTSKINGSFRYEYALPIYHFKTSQKKPNYLFRKFSQSKIRDFPVQYIILNDSYNLSARNLYNYIWN
jgi:hypothetical protein